MVYWAEPGDEMTALYRPADAGCRLPDPRGARARYAERSGRDLAELDFFVALGYWKLAIILEGVVLPLRRRPVRQLGRGASSSSRHVVVRLAEAADEAERRLD